MPAAPTKLPPPSRDAGPLERMPHLMLRVMQLWQTPALSPYVDGLLLDSRDGQRAGLPPGVADELLLVSDINRVARAMRLADAENLSYIDAARRLAREDLQAQKNLGRDDALDDPLVSHDTLRQRERPAASTIARGAVRHDSGVWRNVFGMLGNKWVLAIIVLLVVAKAYWATLGPALRALVQVVK